MVVCMHGESTSLVYLYLNGAQWQSMLVVILKPLHAYEVGGTRSQALPSTIRVHISYPLFFPHALPTQASSWCAVHA